MQQTIQYIKDELTALYPLEEIDGFIRIIFEHQLKLSFTQMIIQKDRILDDYQQKEIYKIVNRLKKYEPIQYILGEAEFYNLNLSVKPGVLIPRPETEELVDWITKINMSENAHILDVGTGSGCIALALKKELPDAQVTAFDVSEEALKIASANANRNKLDINFQNVDILKWEKQEFPEFDIIVSNPPYVRDCEKKMMESNVLDYEPELALFVSDVDPLLFYRTIAGFAQKYLKKGGFLFFEINENFGEATKNLLYGFGFKNIDLKKDIEKKDRMICCEK